MSIFKVLQKRIYRQALFGLAALLLGYIFGYYQVFLEPEKLAPEPLGFLIFPEQKELIDLKHNLETTAGSGVDLLTPAVVEDFNEQLKQADLVWTSWNLIQHRELSPQETCLSQQDQKLLLSKIHPDFLREKILTKLYWPLFWTLRNGQLDFIVLSCSANKPSSERARKLLLYFYLNPALTQSLFINNKELASTLRERTDLPVTQRAESLRSLPFFKDYK